jgi:hypothetical protein
MTLKQLLNFQARLTVFMFLLFLPGIHFGQKTLSYQRITNGLTVPDFDEGRTDFAFNDINMDGNQDILTVGDHGSPFFNSQQHGICVWFGDGQGNFQNFMNGQFGYGGIAVGDVNNDGLKDVGYGIHHNYSSTSFGDQLIEVVLGDGTGMNWEVWDAGLAANGETWGMFGTDFADFNNDGLLDLVSISFGGGAGLHVYLNQGDGSWEQSFGFLGGNSDFLVRACDINNDGFMDFISSHQNGTAYFGNGSGDFTNDDTGLPGAGNTARQGLDIARFNNFNAYGFSCINSSGGLTVFVWNNDNSSWQNLSGNLPASGVYDLSQLCDMNNDGFVDVMAFGMRQFKLWLGDNSGNWTLDATFTTAGNPGNGNALGAGGDLDHNGYPDLIVLSVELTGSFIQFNKNILYVYLENSPADSLWIKPLFPTGNEIFYPGSVQFIEWSSETPGGTTTTVDIEISAFGNQGPWWILAENVPNNGRHQWTVPNLGSDNVYLKLTVKEDVNEASVITQAPFRIVGNSTFISNAESPEKRIAVYPNPGTDYLNISQTDGLKQFILFDCTGNLVLMMDSGFENISTHFLPPGVYHFQAEFNNSGIQSGRWIKLKNP